MNLQSNGEIKSLIGRKPLFKEVPKTKFVLSYVSGIGQLDIERGLNDLSNDFFIVRYPKGVLISDRKGKYKLAFSFSDLKHVEIMKQNDEQYEVIFKTASIKPVVFSFQKKDRLNIVPFIKLLPYKEDPDPREPEVAREQILALKHEFVTSYFTDRVFTQVLRSAGKKDMLLDINEHRIKYGDREVKTAGSLGYTISIQELSHHGVSRFEYGINIFHPEGDLFITFTSVSVFLKEGEYAQLLNRIGTVLFDVVARPVIAQWFDRFANSDGMNYKDFSILRGGLLLKSRTPEVLIHWDELVATSTETFRWPYSNTVFQHTKGMYDVRGGMLLVLKNWLQEDPERLLALMGRTYYVS